MSTRPWLKVTHLATLPGASEGSSYPRKGFRILPGRWVVFDKNLYPAGPTSATEVLSDHTTFEEAAAACTALRKPVTPP